EAAAPTATANEEHLDSFEIVWQTVNDTYFDPTFGGLDWQDAHDRYRPMIAAAESDDEFYMLVNKMLFELNVSHVGVIPPDDLEQVDRVLSAEGSIGIDVRLIDGDAVIVSVDPGSPGALAGLRPGYIVTQVGGKTVEEIASDVYTIPPLHERNERKRLTSAILGRILGESGETVSLTCLDEHGVSVELEIARADRDGRMVFDEAMPPFYIEFEAKRIDGDVGYIRFNAFTPPVDQRFPEALESMHDTRGLIIDLRGNHGGFFPVRKALAEQFAQERALFWSYQARDGVRDVYLEPADSVYQGPLVVLVDVLSASSAEEFSGAMQAVGRATIVGQRTAGVAVTADWMQLPNGATFMYPTTQTRTADGTVLEGRGVIPDVEVALERGLLLQGVDSQLEAAIRALEQEIN
ncbi:MAG: PDZ domain-containing protein, partial [bacterium]|nr:PDZ domain-containing protein [bacterium]